MIMIRFILCIILVVFYFIVMIPVEIIGYTIGIFSHEARNAYMKVMMRIVFASITFMSGAKVKYIGFERIPKEVPVLYVANHESFFDVLLTLADLPGTICFIAKKSFAKIPIFAQALDLYNTLFIDRDSVK